MLRVAIVTVALAGCTGYQPGSFSYGAPGSLASTFEGQRATVGCLDVAVFRRADYDASAVLQYRFGNRCGREVEVDLQRVTVVGRFADGQEVALAPYDPDLELRPTRIGGRLAGREAIAYPTPRPAVQVCVDAASLVHAQPAQWMCFGTPFQGDTDGEPGREGGGTEGDGGGTEGEGDREGGGTEGEAGAESAATTRGYAGLADPFADRAPRANQPASQPEATP